MNSNADDEVDEKKLYDLTHTKLDAWESKDRKSATLRMSDKTGLSDMKIYLTLRAKLHQMEIDLGIYAEDIEEH